MHAVVFLDGAAGPAATMERAAGAVENGAFWAEAAFAGVRVYASGEEGAVALLRAALADICGRNVPLVTAELRLAPAVATIRAGLDAAIAPEDVRLLRTGVTGTEQRATATLSRDGEWWTVWVGATSARQRDTKGLRYLAELISCSPVERHVLDLVDLAEGTPTHPGLDRRRLGDAGELLDASAKAAYRRRIEELRAEVEAALHVEDDDRAARADAEIDALVAELSRAVGIGGRHRRAASATERARLNVTRALRAAIARVGEAQPAAAASLGRAVRTGFYCAYEPSPDDQVVWSVGR